MEMTYVHIAGRYLQLDKEEFIFGDEERVKIILYAIFLWTRVNPVHSKPQNTSYNKSVLVISYLKILCLIFIAPPLSTY